ncbi:TetR/AcrR family transcriptional regulator [Demetria terragena]|uniref:TetR/AcrR family transcriptional regulator n=1 Tax=Demetria terragena TaxID=63959 RepID=UPI0003600816|nr:TetR/AcrR family transcriptional regulator [Demetria terragena]
MARDDLIDSALATLNQSPSSSMADIAEAAGISRATLNRHFASRDALIGELGRRALDRWEGSLDDSGDRAAIKSGDPSVLREAITTLLRHYVADAEIFGFTLTETRLDHIPDLADRARALERREQALISAAQRAGVLRSDVTPQWISWSVFGALVGTRDGLRFGDLARRGLEDTLVTTFLEGFSA